MQPEKIHAFSQLQKIAAKYQLPYFNIIQVKQATLGEVVITGGKVLCQAEKNGGNHKIMKLVIDDGLDELTAYLLPQVRTAFADLLEIGNTLLLKGRLAERRLPESRKWVRFLVVTSVELIAFQDWDSVIRDLCKQQAVCTG